jgi:hypothetical protein
MVRMGGQEHRAPSGAGNARLPICPHNAQTVQMVKFRLAKRCLQVPIIIIIGSDPGRRLRAEVDPLRRFADFSSTADGWPSIRTLSSTHPSMWLVLRMGWVQWPSQFEVACPIMTLRRRWSTKFWSTTISGSCDEDEMGQNDHLRRVLDVMSFQRDEKTRSKRGQKRRTDNILLLVNMFKTAK